VPQGVDPAPLARWAKPPVQDERGVYPEREFSEALADAGLVLSTAPVMDGNLHRVPAVGDEPGQKSGAYVGHLDGHPAGFIQNYKTGYESKWKSSARMARLSQEERERLEAEAEKRKGERERERQHLADETALLVAAVWAASELAEAHPYLAAKGVQSYGLRVNMQEPLALAENKTDEPQRWSSHGALLVPVHDADGKFLGAQSIDATGNKSFPRGSRLQGGHFIIGEPSQSDIVLISEGYATVATVHELTKLPVIVAFHCGNLPVVAQAFHERHPEKMLIIAGENDHSKPLEKNVGRLKAQEAAEKVGGYPLSSPALIKTLLEATGMIW
jgi:putative DNA primase/helicase